MTKDGLSTEDGKTLTNCITYWLTFSIRKYYQALLQDRLL
jgi:hypothetical protein